MSYVPDMYCDARGDRPCTIVPGLSGGCITVTTEGYSDRGVGLERPGTQADLPGPLKQAERAVPSMAYPGILAASADAGDLPA